MDRPNIIWITLDSIRQDKCSTYGYVRETTPNLSKFAKTGTAFSECFAHGIWSLPSVSSILTGTQPSVHQMGAENGRLPDSIKTVPEAFSDSGYRTVGISANPWFSESTGLNRGFDDFTSIDRSNILSIGLPRLIRYALSLNTHSGGYTTDTAKIITEYLTTGLIEAKVDALVDNDSPFFLYAHTDGAHTPYFPPKKSLSTFADSLSISPKDARKRVYEIHQNLYREIANGLDYTDETWDALDIMYDTLIHYVDKQLGALLETIQNKDIQNTIIIISSDHGDLLGEEGLLSHKISLHDGLLHVPLVISSPYDLDISEDSLVQHIDIMKTLMTFCGIDTGSIQGVNLNKETREFAISRRGAEYFDKSIGQIKDHNPEFDETKYHYGVANCIRNKDYKLIKSDSKVELFRISDNGLHVADEDTEAKVRMESELERILEAFGKSVVSTKGAEFDESTKRRLKDLGYVE